MKFDELIEGFEYSVKDYYLDVFNKDGGNLEDLIEKVWFSKSKCLRAYVYKSSTPEDVTLVDEFASSLGNQRGYEILKEKEFYFIVCVKTNDEGIDIEDNIICCDDIYIKKEEAEEKALSFLKNIA